MMFIGYFVALMSAVGVTWHGRTVQVVKKTVPTMVLLAVKSLIAAAVVGILAAMWGQLHVPATTVWIGVVSMIAIEFAIDFAFTRSHQLGDQSQVGPLMGVTPIFLLPAGLLFLGDTFDFAEICGVALVGVGCVLANLKQGAGSVAGALATIWSSAGARWMLLHGVLGVVAVSFAKYNFNEGVPVLQFAFCVLLGQSGVAFVLATARDEWKKLHSTNYRATFYVGLSFGFVQTAHFVGLSLLPAAFLASIKRLSIVFDVIVGRQLGKETEWFTSRFLGAIVILSGVLLFTLF